MNTERDTTIRDALIEKLTRDMEGKIERGKLEAMIGSLKAAALSLSTGGNAGGGFFGIGIHLQTYPSAPPTMRFDGSAGGLFGVGGEVFKGDLYSDDFSRLYSSTASIYVFFSTPFHAIVFYDSGHNVIGHFEGAGSGSLPGTGGGTGEWRSV
jgi:hypothetical protein